MSFSEKDPRLANDLLLGPKDNVPSEYTLLHDVTFSGVKGSYARLYKIRHPAPTASTPTGGTAE
jgi:hypothetical protein